MRHHNPLLITNRIYLPVNQEKKITSSFTIPNLINLSMNLNNSSTFWRQDRNLFFLIFFCVVLHSYKIHVSSRLFLQLLRCHHHRGRKQDISLSANLKPMTSKHTWLENIQRIKQTNSPELNKYVVTYNIICVP